MFIYHMRFRKSLHTLAYVAMHGVHQEMPLVTGFGKLFHEFAIRTEMILVCYIVYSLERYKFTRVLKLPLQQIGAFSILPDT